MNVAGFARTAAAAALAAAVSGCATGGVPPRSSVTAWPYGEYDKVKPAIEEDVKGCLKLGDQYRDLTHTYLFQTPAYGLAYWYAEEAEKFYGHVLDELEPHNAYAAVCMGYLSLIRARAVKSAKEKDLLFSAAHARLVLANEKRKGYKHAHVYLGELYAMREDWGRAIAEFEQLAASGLDDAYVHAWWGYALKRQGRADEARQHFRTAIDKGGPERSANWAQSQL